MSKSTRRPTTFRPEAQSLEGRSLLSAGLSARGIHAAAAVHNGRPVVPGPATPISFVRAQVAGSRASDGLYSPAPLTDVSFSGSGKAGVFGPVLFGTEFRIVSATNTIPTGTALLTTLKGGNQLRLQFTGTTSATVHGTTSWSWTGTVASGTGRFEGATGIFSATGSATYGRGFNLSLNIKLDPPV